MSLRLEAATRLGSFELDVALETSSTLALAGPSGAGKSTVLRIVAGLLRPHRGRVACGDEVWLDTGRGVDVEPEKRRCGFVFQDYALFPHLSAAQNVAYGLRDTPRAERRDRALALLDRFGVEPRADARPHTLSGGERQRVALARALAREPRVLLLDEPLAALDARTRAAASRELATALRDAAVPALIVTHDFTEAALLGDEVAVVDAGRVVQRGEPAELAARPTSSFVADLTGAVVLTGTASPADGGLTAVALDGGGTVFSTDVARGPVAATVYPWEITLGDAAGSAQNRLEAEIASLTAIGNRTRVGLLAPQPLTAEITGAAAEQLSLRAGDRVTATWKAAATRLVER